MAEDKKDETADPNYGPDPDLYARMSEPYEDKDTADASLNRFLLGVKRLREECGVAEVMVLAANHFEPEAEAKETVTVRALALGNPTLHAELGAMAYQQYTLPDVLRAARLAKIAQGGKP